MIPTRLQTIPIQVTEVQINNIFMVEPARTKYEVNPCEHPIAIPILEIRLHLGIRVLSGRMELADQSLKINLATFVSRNCKI